ncbi:MAG: S9 family peptidase [Armatimonadetes bacterium]|nr:S9 family peptidase [Armatimonadota bacterium]
MRRGRRKRSPAAKQAPKRGPRKRKITPEDILKFHLVSDPQISPEGRRVLFSKKHVGEKNEYVTNLWVVDADGGEPRQFTSGGKDGHGRWSPDGTRMAFLSGREKPKAQIFVMSAQGGEAVALTKFPEGAIGEFRWSPDGSKIAVTFREQDPEWTQEAKKKRDETGRSTPARTIEDLWYRLDGDGYFNGQRHHLYVVDANTGEHRKVFDKDPTGWIGFDWSPDSKELAIAANLDRNALLKPWKQRLYRLNVKSAKIKEIPNQPDGTRESVLWSPDGKRLAYVGREGREDIWGAKNDHLFVCDARTGRPKSLTGGEDYCVAAVTLSDTREAVFGANVQWTPDGKRLFFTVGWHGEQHVASVDARGGPTQFHTKGPGDFGMGNLSASGKRMALSVGSSLKLNEIAVGTVGAKVVREKNLTNFNGPLLSEMELSKPEEHWVTSEDGTRIHVWVLKPAGFKKGGKVPAVLEIHGGPHCQYGVPFFHEFQVLTANGYAVFYSNPRGSKGYGEAHCSAIKGDWGHKDWEDVQAVIRFMGSQPYVDRKRMGVMGGSYGGYMTNWVVGHTNAFAGAITDRCVSNLVSMAGNSDFPLVPDRYWDGNAWDRPETLWNQSPIKYFGNVKTPTLVIHSEGDLRCNVEQSEQVYTALKLRKVPTRFVRYPAETSHGLSRSGPPDLRIHRLGEILRWWKKYIGKPARSRAR